LLLSYCCLIAVLLLPCCAVDLGRRGLKKNARLAIMELAGRAFCAEKGQSGGALFGFEGQCAEAQQADGEGG